MKITSALLSLSLLLFSCSHNNETEALFLKADSLMDEYPDSVLQLLNIQPEEIEDFSDKECARYALLLARATDKCKLSLLPCDSLLNVALEYYDDDEKIYLNSPICPFNELVDRLNMKLCDNIGLNKHFNYNWFKSVNNSVESCCKMTKPIKYDGEYWSLIGGQAHVFIADTVNAFYSCYMAFNPSDLLSNNHDARYKTIENKKYYGPVDEYIKCIYDKNMEIPDFDYDSKDIKSSCVSFPSPKLVKELNLSFNFLTSSWNNENGKIIIWKHNFIVSKIIT